MVWAIGNLTSAISIDLSENELGGKLPRSLANLYNLREIKLSSNNGSQEISEILENLLVCLSDRLEILRLFNSQLYGHLTDELGLFKNLAVLYLANNSVSGPLPLSLGSFSSLGNLDLSNNLYNGIVPQNFGQLSKLHTLHIGSNMLEHYTKIGLLHQVLIQQN